ncbi:hypothetical protein Tco_0380685, partial [Tanacetum coccineum]
GDDEMDSEEDEDADMDIDEEDEDDEMEDVPTVQDFPEVFPEDLPGLPPDSTSGVPN